MSYDALNADQRAGTTLNGKPSFTIASAAIQLDRSGHSWSTALGAPATVTYAYRATAPATMPDDTAGFSQFTSQQIYATDAALKLWSELANITFTRIGSGAVGNAAFSDQASILFGDYGSGESGAAAFAYQPGSRAASSAAGDVWVNVSQSANRYVTNSFDYGFETLVHEIGHALGLSHPSDYDASADATLTYAANASYAEDSREYSVMSYFAASSTGASIAATAPAGPLLDDIAAVQRLYGANMQTRAGDTVYGYGYGHPVETLAGENMNEYSSGANYWASIWDGGGNDTFDFSNASVAQKIDLHAGAFSNVLGNVGNLSIAQGVTIENAIGGEGGDVLIGNDVANVLSGNGGDDLLIGNGGNDTLNGGAGTDTAAFAEMLQQATILRSAATNLTVSGPDGSDRLTSIELLKFADGTVQLVDAKPLIDDLFYAQRNLDVFHSGMDPDDHYMTFGWREGRDPDAFFSNDGYLAANGDVRRANLIPLVHYDTSGWREGRDPAATFDTTLYLLHNPDVKNANIDPLAHYLQYGRYEGRAAYAAIGPQIYDNGFDPEYYLLANPDIAAAVLRTGQDANAFAYQHYETTGWKEGRNPNAWFDDAGYLATYKDVAAAGMDPLDHYAQFGWREGRDPSAQFDTVAYLAHNQDVARAGLDPLLHYLRFGAYELRSSYADGAFHV